MILVIGGAYQGKYEFVKKTFGVSDEKILCEFHKHTKRWLAEGKDMEQILDEALHRQYEVIICDEIGSGIVPLERETRDWREQTGRALCEIAKYCDRVYRVQCGIGSCIKDETQKREENAV